MPDIFYIDPTPATHIRNNCAMVREGHTRHRRHGDVGTLTNCAPVTHTTNIVLEDRFDDKDYPGP